MKPQRITLNDLLPAAAQAHYAIPCFNVFGLDEALAVVQAADEIKQPVIIAANKDLTAMMGFPLAAAMLSEAASRAQHAPVCVHLDHCSDENDLLHALDAGFASVMFDGSQLPLAENIRRTQAMAQEAHKRGVSIEGEIGSVPYNEGKPDIKSEITKPQEALQFIQETNLDAVAVSIGNVHRLQTASATIDFSLLQVLSEQIPIPLVLHGASGVQPQDLRQIAKTTVAKCNIGTRLRLARYQALKRSLQQHPERANRLATQADTMPAVQKEASRWLELLGSPPKR